MVIGGGIGGLILTLVLMFLGINPSDVPIDTGGSAGQGQVDTAGDASSELLADCETGADANEDIWCRMVGAENSVQAFWAAELPRYGREWREPTLTLYQGQTQSACGTASNQVGPFYCPLDQGIYIDADFFQILEDRFGPRAVPWPRCTWSPTSSVTPSRTSSASSAEPSRTLRARSPARCASSSWRTASPGSGPSTPPRPRARERRPVPAAAHR
jgi:hypothetical protein